MDFLTIIFQKNNSYSIIGLKELLFKKKHIIMDTYLKVSNPKNVNF